MSSREGLRVLAVGSMYPPHSLGGYEVIWRSSTEQLRAAGHDVRVLTTDYRDPAAAPADDEQDIHRELRWYWHDHDFPRLGYPARLRLERDNRATLDRHLDEHRPDVVAWWAMGGMSLSMIEECRRRGLPAVGVVCDDWMLYGPEVDQWTRAFRRRPGLAGVADRLTGVPTRLNLGDAATWLFISDFCRQNALGEMPRMPRTAIAHAGVTAQRFHPGPEREWSGRLLYAGRIDPRKGIATAIEALAELPEPMRLDVVGSGDHAHLEELRALAECLGVAGRTSFRENVDQDRLRDLYAEADALLFPVIWPEPWGLVPIEAMACGTPVVATGTGGSGEYLRDRSNCLRVQPGDAGELAAAVRTLAESPDLRASLRANGLATAREHTEERFNVAVETEMQRAARAGR